MTYAELNEKYAALNPWIRFFLFLIGTVLLALTTGWIIRRWILKGKLENHKKPDSN